MTQLDYTFDRQIMLEREDARREGRAEGEAKGEARIIKNMLLVGVSDSNIKLFVGCGQELIDKIKKEL